MEKMGVESRGVDRSARAKGGEGSGDAPWAVGVGDTPCGAGASSAADLQAMSTILSEGTTRIFDALSTLSAAVEPPSPLASADPLSTMMNILW